MTDEVKVVIRAGKGGDGAATFRREKFVPRGGPDGGDGGDGGSVILIAENKVNTLAFFAKQKVFQAEDGVAGGNRRRTGKNGADLFLEVPTGTLVTDVETGKTLVDLTSVGQQILVAKGGQGGRGNTHFATATHQAPRFAERGTLGEQKNLKLELKLIADFGIIGLPNSGKSTLLSALSKARPKIAPYPFTTLEPNLGSITFKKRHFVLADIPGLIKESSRGKGLGDKFLRHIERTKALIHLIDATNPSPKDAYQTIREELKNFNPNLLLKPEILVLNKIDLVANPDIKGLPPKPILISAQKKIGLEKLASRLEKTLDEKLL